MSDTELEEREKQGGEQEKIEGGLAPKELAALDQIEAGLRDGDEAENEAVDDEIPYRDEGGKKKLRGRFSRRQKAITGGIAAAVVTGGVGLSIYTAPIFVVSHLRELITTRLSQLQVDHSRRYRRSKINKISDLFSKDGRAGGKMIAEMESRGYRFSYDPDTKKVVGLTLPDGSRSLIGPAIGDHIDDYLELRHPLRNSRWKTKRTSALYRRYGISRRSIVTPPDKPVDNPDVEVNKRLAQNTLGDPVDLESKPGDIPPNETDAQRAAREAREAVVKDASETSGVMGEIREAILEGEDIDVAARNAGIEAGGDAVEQLGAGAGAGALKTAQAIASGRSVSSRLLGGFKSFLSPTDILDKVCVAKGRLRMSTVVARNHRALALFKYSSSFIAVGDATRTGKVDPKLLSSVMKRVTALDRNGNPIGASPGFAYAVKGKFSKSKNDSFKGSYAVDGQLSGTWKGVQDATDNIPGTGRGQCAVIQNPLVQIGSTVVITVGKAALCAVSLLTGCAATQAVQEGVRISVTQAVKASIQNSIRNIFTKQVLRSLALTAAVELSFEAIMILTQLHIEKSLALPFTNQERGGDLGSILTAGGGVANKQRSLEGGMVPATTEQYRQAEEEFLVAKKLETSQQSFFTRILDIDNPDSAAFRFAATYPVGLSGMMSAIRLNITKPASWVLNGGALQAVLGNIGGGLAYADDEISYDEYVLEKGKYEGQGLAVDFAGNPQVILRPDIANVDPEENISYLSSFGDIDPNTFEIKSKRFKDHVANCVETIDIISRIEFESDPTTPEKDCMAVNPLTVRFKAHLAYLDMIDGIEAEFIPEDI